MAGEEKRWWGGKDTTPRLQGELGLDPSPSTYLLPHFIRPLRGVAVGSRDVTQGEGHELQGIVAGREAGKVRLHSRLSTIDHPTHHLTHHPMTPPFITHPSTHPPASQLSTHPATPHPSLNPHPHPLPSYTTFISHPPSNYTPSHPSAYLPPSYNLSINYLLNHPNYTHPSPHQQPSYIHIHHPTHHPTTLHPTTYLPTNDPATLPSINHP